MKKIAVKNLVITVRENDYISLTDIAKYRNNDEPRFVIQNWMKTIDTFSFLGLWESINNPSFNRVEFDTVKKEVGSNYFTMTPKKWVENFNPIGIVSNTGRYGGTYAHKDIAFEFASWISPEFKLYLIVEYQRLKEKESKSIEWNVSRELSKINYKVHTDAINRYIVPTLLEKQIYFVYASEADMLNVALFGLTAKEWREANKDKEGNIRDYAMLEQLICLANLESINSVLIKEGINQSERLVKLNEIARSQMKLLIENQKKIKMGEK